MLKGRGRGRAMARSGARARTRARIRAKPRVEVSEEEKDRPEGQEQGLMWGVRIWICVRGEGQLWLRVWVPARVDGKFRECRGWSE